METENKNKDIFKGIRILVIDDERVMRDLFTRILKGRGCQVTSVASGEEGIVKIKEESFAIVFIDVVMPGIDGIETFRAIKEIKPDVGAVIMTAFTVKDKIKEALSLGAFDYLYKPFDIVEIMAVIKKFSKRDKLRPLPEKTSRKVNNEGK